MEFAGMDIWSKALWKLYCFYFLSSQSISVPEWMTITRSIIFVVRSIPISFFFYITLYIPNIAKSNQIFLLWEGNYKQSGFESVVFGPRHTIFINRPAQEMRENSSSSWHSLSPAFWLAWLPMVHIHPELFAHCLAFFSQSTAFLQCSPT